MKSHFLAFLLLASSFCFGQTITAAEYFFNTDPGIGNGTSLTVNANTGTLAQTFNISTTGLDEGFHSLYIRTKNSNDVWSLYERQTIYIKNIQTTNITAAEYFFNLDPGVGNGTSLSVDTNSGALNQTYSIPTTSLSEGFHSLYIRTQNSNGVWSLYERQTIYIKDFNFIPDNVIAAEYFIDLDPGIGNGTSVNFGNSNATQILNIDSTGFSQGDHIFYIRVQDTNGDWSLYDSIDFTVSGVLSTESHLLKQIKVHPNPFNDYLLLQIPNHVEILETKIFNAIGQQVFESNANISSIETKPLNSGIYILSLKTSKGNVSYKIVKN
jgi:hypothetical protein